MPLPAATIAAFPDLASFGERRKCPAARDFVVESFHHVYAEDGFELRGDLAFIGVAVELFRGIVEESLCAAPVDFGVECIEIIEVTLMCVRDLEDSIAP